MLTDFWKRSESTCETRVQYALATWLRHERLRRPNPFLRHDPPTANQMTTPEPLIIAIADTQDAARLRLNCPGPRIHGWSRWAKLIAWALVAIGVAIRVIVFTHNRSLFLDEAMLANNIVQRDAVGLLKPLADAQAAPVGFLMIEKTIVSTFGVSERALRSLPLIGGAASLVF